MTPKSVHFSSRHLTTVRTFKRTGKPAALLSLTASDTETESEVLERFPFPCSATPTYALHSDPIPCPGSVRPVVVESLRLTNLTLQGTLLVKNVAYAKDVSVRFTLDDWRTTSEVAARYTASLSSLPLATSSVFTGEVSAGSSWDRFTFSIKLEDYSSSLAARTLYFAARYAAAGGEWWDNNMGHDYRVQFQHSESCVFSHPLF
ncbi:putative phosphatase regulatory subunit-domain-containing protein [Mucidula mucida]|nr:putative phosphatase regulatory subunit-domain-containing protein [Mucidula mucida]